MAQASRQFGADPGEGPEQRLGGRFPPQPVELLPPAGGDHFGDRRRYAWPDRGQSDQSFASFAGEDHVDRLGKRREGGGRPPVGSGTEGAVPLLLEQAGEVAEFAGDPLIQRARRPAVQHGGFRMLLQSLGRQIVDTQFGGQSSAPKAARAADTLPSVSESPRP